MWKRVLRWAVLALWLAWAAVMAVQAVQICERGLEARRTDSLAPIFRQEEAAEAVRNALPLLGAAAGASLIALLVGARDPDRDKPAADEAWACAMLKARVTAPSDDMLDERRARRAVALVTGLGLALFAVPFFLALTDRGWFLERETPLTGELILRLAPWPAFAFILMTVAALARRESFRRELHAAKGLPRGGSAPLPRAGVRLLPALRWALLAAAAGLVIWGALNGGVEDVLKKAIMICTECVGLG